ncbi:carboxymuconolactone decarboxylase family protein [Amycolatopsis silviterrae]|uniref:Carboxymuconolactone decarboxylase family protein n=1 Tax=Amycolatopsis silviterrae TaxID=1656914 RepID=A0ABW5HNN9_9PSEU
MIKDEFYERGLRLRHAMFGSAGAEAQTESATWFTDKLQELVTRHAYGDIWARAGLDRRDRSLVTLAMLVALGRLHELEFHLEGAIANGVTAEEIRELLLHATLYCGMPAAVDGFQVAERAIPGAAEPLPRSKSPVKLSHVVLQTNQLEAMRDWYCRVLGAKPAYENENMAFLAYDGEHHRVGLVSFDEYEAMPKPVVGLQHVSFTYDSLETLLGNYERLKAESIAPAWSVNHGPTISMYYADPDGNHVELQVDVFETAEEVNAFLAGPVYRNNPRGTEFDPDEMIARLRAGASFTELTRRTDQDQAASLG